MVLPFDNGSYVEPEDLADLFPWAKTSINEIAKRRPVVNAPQRKQDEGIGCLIWKSYLLVSPTEM